MIDIFKYSIFFAIMLAFNDIINMSITKKINLNELSSNWLYFTYLLYGFQMIIFYYGIKITPMSVLNLTWNLLSNIVIMIIGIYYFKENITHLETWGILFALFALFLFVISKFNNLST
jgi:multidrug transporter EmrE-like cation transporter